MLKGVEVIEVNPAYTSVIDMLKYAPQLSIDKDTAGAYVIGRRALGFKEDMPENYERLLEDKAYLEFALKRYEERERVAKTTLQSAWQVVKVAFLFPILGKVLPRDFSSLKPLLVEGVWDRVRSRLVPLEVGGASR